MKIIDQYLIRQFLQTVFFALLAFILIFLVIDAMENLDDFIDQNVPWINILHYYVVFTPEIIKLITPVAVLFGALFTAGKVSTLSELTAMRASGVSLYRFMTPFVVTALLITFYFSLFRRIHCTDGERWPRRQAFPSSDHEGHIRRICRCSIAPGQGRWTICQTTHSADWESARIDL